MVQISANFDAGNIEVVNAENPKDIRLRIKPDPYTVATDKRSHLQWFYFQVANCQGLDLTITLTNAGEASFAQWEGYHTVYSYDRKNWLRAKNTTYDSAKGYLKFSLQAKENYVWFAYFAPYSHERHMEFISEVSQRTKVRSLGLSLDGRSIDMIEFGHGKKQVWIAGRQHPGESMAEWLIEGLVRKLFDSQLGTAIGEAATVRIIPNINPDGSIRGHLRTNACGANLNREWAPTGDYVAPTLERSPEVYYVLKELDKQGCDLYVDVHGDEGIDANFFAGSEGIPNYSEKQKHLFSEFKKALLEASRDFQVEKGYPLDAPRSGNLALCTNQVAQRFGCLAVTLEQPFKDTWNNPHPDEGWSPRRAMGFGADLLVAIEKMLRQGL